MLQIREHSNEWEWVVGAIVLDNGTCLIPHAIEADWEPVAVVLTVKPIDEYWNVLDGVERKEKAR